MVFSEINWSSSSNPLVSFFKGVGETMSAGHLSSIGNPVGLLVVLVGVLVTLFGVGFQSLGVAISAASLVGGVLSLLMVPLGLLTSSFVYLFIATLVIGIFLLIIERR